MHNIKCDPKTQSFRGRNGLAGLSEVSVFSVHGVAPYTDSGHSFDAIRLDFLGTRGQTTAFAELTATDARALAQALIEEATALEAAPRG